MRTFFLFLIVLLVSAPVSAETKRYSTWSGSVAAGGGGGEDLQKLIDELGALIDEAEKARAADPRFLQDIRNLTQRYERPWRKLLLSDDFHDGDFAADPAWAVSAGRFTIERGWGLRSYIEPTAATAETEPEKPATDRDVAVSLLQGILRQATRQKGGAEKAPPAARTEQADIHTAAAITNAFIIEMRLSSWKSPGRLEFGPYQGADRQGGYRLVYTPGGPLSLVRQTARGVSVVDSSAEPVVLEDKKVHQLSWTRLADGTMKVAIDDKEVLSTFDRGFRDPFDGFVLVNKGGDYILGRLDIHGTE
jgi:hypothetical protein